jgi:hypothetical protein
VHEDADPNAQAILELVSFDPKVQCKSLKLLEEAILSRSIETIGAMEIFIDKGADVHKVSKEIKKKFSLDVTLLHLAILTPEEMKTFDGIRSVDRPPKPKTLFEIHQEQDQKKILSYPHLKIFLKEEEPLRLDPYTPENVVKLLLKKGLKSKLNAQTGEDKKTVLDWVNERRFLYTFNLQTSELDPQRLELELEMEDEYKNVIELLRKKK